MCLAFFRAGTGHILVQKLCVGGCPVHWFRGTLAPAHAMPAAAPNHDNQKCLQTLPSVLSEAEWPPDEDQMDFYLSGVIPGSWPSVEHLWGENSRQGKAVGRVQAPGRGCIPLGLPKAGTPVTHRSLGGRGEQDSRFSQPVAF